MLDCTIEQLADDVLMGRCHIGEDDVLPSAASFPFLQDVHSESRRKELWAEHVLLCRMTGDDSLHIGHEPSGKPFVEGWNVSISHTRGHVVMMLSRQLNVALDIEQPMPRIAKLAGRFLREDEQATTLEELTCHWCAKETAYKYYSSRRLTWHDMRVSLQPQGRYAGFVELFPDGERMPFYLTQADNCVLVYAYG